MWTSDYGIVSYQTGRSAKIVPRVRLRSPQSPTPTKFEMKQHEWWVFLVNSPELGIGGLKRNGFMLEPYNCFCTPRKVVVLMLTFSSIAFPLIIRHSADDNYDHKTKNYHWADLQVLCRFQRCPWNNGNFLKAGVIKYFGSVMLDCSDLQPLKGPFSQVSPVDSYISGLLW